jgi:hypothetical protein
MFDEMITVIKQTHKWKSPGLDKLPATLLCLLVYSDDASVVHPTTLCFVFFCHIAHPAFTINLSLHDVPVIITHIECLILGYYS